MRRVNFVLVSAAAIGVLSTNIHAVPFTPGNLAVYRTGTGAGAVSNVATAVFIDEYDPATGSLLQSIALPETDPDGAGPQRRLVAQGNATLEGLINRSLDGRYLLLAGYDKEIGGSAPASDNATITSRIVGRIDVNGIIDTSTVMSDADIGIGSPRSVISDNGANLWVGTANGGVRFTTLGSTTSTKLTVGDGNPGTEQNDVRHIDVFGGQLYGSTSTATRTGVFAVGTGLSSTAPALITPLTGVASGQGTNTGTGATGAGTVQFFMADLDGGVAGIDTLYVAGDGLAALTKYSLVDGTWTSNGTIGDGPDGDVDGSNNFNDENYRGLTGSVSGTTVTLYSIRHGINDNNNIHELVRMTDSTGYNGAWSNPVGGPTVIATGPANVQFKGVEFVPLAPAGVAGDYNGNGIVDGADYVVWRNNEGATGNPTASQGNGDGDNDVDSADYAFWRARVGNTSGSGMSLGEGSAAVPEPAAWILMAIAAMTAIGRRGQLLVGRR